MTHSPPLPAGNQSPYPIQEPPLSERIPIERSSNLGKSNIRSIPWTSVGVVLGIGAIALAIRGLIRAQSEKSTDDHS